VSAWLAVPDDLEQKSKEAKAESRSSKVSKSSHTPTCLMKLKVTTRTTNEERKVADI